MRRAALLVSVVAIAAPAACDSGSEPDASELPEPDCAHPLVWNGESRRAVADVALDRLDGRLDEGVIEGCGEAPGPVVPDELVTVLRIRGVHPDVAVASSGKETGRLAWLAPGYLVESPRHPFHGAFYGDRAERDRPARYECGPRLVAAVTSLSTPVPEAPTLLRVEAEDPAIEALLQEAGTDRIVSLHAGTDVEGVARRHGVPRVRLGDELTLVLRVCDGEESEAGAAGIRLLVAERLRAR